MFCGCLVGVCLGFWDVWEMWRKGADTIFEKVCRMAVTLSFIKKVDKRERTVVE